MAPSFHGLSLVFYMAARISDAAAITVKTSEGAIPYYGPPAEIRRRGENVFGKRPHDQRAVPEDSIGRVDISSMDVAPTGQVHVFVGDGGSVNLRGARVGEGGTIFAAAGASDANMLERILQCFK